MEPEDVQKALLVTMLQIKDYVAVMAYHHAPEQAASVQKLHDAGKTVCDFPFYDPMGVGEDE